MVRMILAALALSGFVATDVLAQADYPNRPVRIVVPSGAGGGTDTTARILAEQLTQSIGGQFVVENRPGAAQMIGIEFVARAPNDGYTLLVAASPITILPAVNPKVRFDVLRDFVPVSQLVIVPSLLVSYPKLPAANLKEFIALANQKPGAMNYASAGPGTQPHMAMELFKVMADVDLVHVPFKGVAPAIPEILAGRLSSMFLNLMTAKPHVDAGTLRALAISSAKRSSVMSNVPTVAEVGVPGYEAIQWFALFAPAGTPPAIIDRLHKATALAMQSPAMRKRLAADGAEAVGNSPAEFTVIVKSELEKWARVARAAKLK